jgi:hypothetical protein
MGGRWVDDWGSSYTVNADGSFSIPFAQDFLDDLSHGSQNLEFTVFVDSGNSEFRVTVDYSGTVSSSNLTGTEDDRLLNVGSLGSVSLASITLSGTLTVHDNGSPLGRVHINARDAQDNYYIASASLTNPSVTGESWSMNIPVQQGGPVTFWVDGYDSPNGGNRVLSKPISPDSTSSVNNTSISNISLNLGDISVGRMSGTVSFTDMPSPAPYWIGISARYGSWEWISPGQGFEIKVSDGTWAILGDDAFLAALETGEQTVTFSIYVQMTQNGGGFEVAQIERTVSKNGLGSVNLGTVSLGVITLSGTITVHNNGNPLGNVNIDARDANNNQITWTSLTYPDINGAPWYMYIPVQQGEEVTFQVYGYDSPNGGNQVLTTTIEPENTAFVSNTSISGIDLYIGDISEGRMVGTVTFTDIPSPAPYRVTVYAEYLANSSWEWINNGQGYGIEVSGDTGTWAIPRDEAFLAALDARDQEVTFYINVQMTGNENPFRIGEVIIPVSKTGLDSVNLGTVSLGVITLSGTITIHDNGTPLGSVYIAALDAQNLNNQIGRTTLTYPSVNGASWSMYIPVQQGEEVTFQVYGYDSPNGGNQVFFKTFTPDLTTSVSDTSISGIDLYIGDISEGRMEGTVTFTDIPSPAPYRVYISARYWIDTYWALINYGQSYEIEVSGDTGTWTIPRDEAFLAALDARDQDVTFLFYVQMTENGNSLYLGEIEKTVSETGLGSVNLGTVSLDVITLSGTATVTYNGKPAPQVQISASTESQGQVASVYLNSPNNAAWVMHLKPFATTTDISFSVRGWDSEGYTLFEANTGETVSVIDNNDVGNIAIDYDYVFPPASPIALTIDQWTNGDLAAGEEDWYMFTAGGTYYVSWNDDYEGDEFKTCDIKVTAYTSNGDIISGFSGADSAYSTPRQLSGQTGTVYLKVQGYGSSDSGTYAIGYSQNSNGISKD